MSTGDLIQLGAPAPSVKNLVYEKSTNIRDHFPFPTIRPGQEAGLTTLTNTVARNKKFTLIEAPTGTGKSGLAIAATSWAKTIPCNTKPGGYILSPQKTLTAQYMKDFEPMGLLEMKGKANYWCDRHNTDCDTGALLNNAEDNGDSRSVCDGCPYKSAKNAIINSPLGGVMNFAYYLNETQYAGQLGTRSMLVLDEGHNTEDQVLGFTDTLITRKRSDEFGAGAIPEIRVGENGKTRDWCHNTFIPAILDYMNSLKLNIDDAKLSYNREEAVKYAKKLDFADKFLCRLNRFTNSDDPGNWISWTDKESGDLIIKPLTATLFADEVLFRKAEHILLMSATILDFATVMRNLGIRREDAETLAMPSEFPLENRPIFYRPVGFMSYKYIDETLPKMGAAVEKILQRYHDKKGIIHTHSYKINSYLIGYLRARGFASRIITHNNDVAGSRDKAVFDHMMSPEPTVLCSPSMTEGLDLKEDLSRFQVITKVPYPALDPYVKARMERDRDWYNWKTGLALVQATGRSVRSNTDKAHTFILDKSFDWFRTQYGNRLPRWWTDSIR